MSSIIKGAEKKIEIWIIGQSDVYSLEAKTKKAKEDFANELRRVIIEQKDKAGLKPNSNNSNTGKFPLLSFLTRNISTWEHLKYEAIQPGESVYYH